MVFEEQREIIGKELSLCHEDSSLSPFLNPSLLSHEVAYEDLKVFDKVVFKEDGRNSWNFENFVATSPHLNFEVVEFEKYQYYSSIINAFGYLCKAWESLKDFQDTLRS
ncbi:hypothetical protein M9H77_03084 [Catharanthus roseus]|uniref:Uncharacterized protein n=1 Tax=Catharanthus roseus TaxID=4058 RepID=A0ACC0CA98_CATRO|nr:hypothetical protein M9H77_03084 [Catharanthus roseus]